MGTGSNTGALNEMLQAIKDWQPSTASDTVIHMAAYTTDIDTAVLTTAVATYSTPSAGAMDITGNVVLNIDAGESVAHLRIEKSPSTGTAEYIYRKDIVAETFTFAGTITITSAEISIADA